MRGFEIVEDVRPQCGGEEAICFVSTAGAEDIGVEVHDAADARTLLLCQPPNSHLCLN